MIMWRGWINQAAGYTYIPIPYSVLVPVNRRINSATARDDALSKHRPMTSSTGVALEIIRPSRNKKQEK
ncbi:hypothetical protein GGI42DRAFT_329591 [Trichoderma sp. SZMC 28013]